MIVYDKLWQTMKNKGITQYANTMYPLDSCHASGRTRTLAPTRSTRSAIY